MSDQVDRLSLIAHWECPFGHTFGRDPGERCPRRVLDDDCGAPVVKWVRASDYEGAVDPAEIVAWLRGRTGAHGGGFTSADDVADAIEREFVHRKRGQSA